MSITVMQLLPGLQPLDLSTSSGLVHFFCLHFFRAKIQFEPTQKHLKHQLSLLDEADAYQVGGVHADFIPERVHALFRKHAKFHDAEVSERASLAM